MERKSCLVRTYKCQYRVQFARDTTVYLVPLLEDIPICSSRRVPIIVEIVPLPSWRPSHIGLPKPVAHTRDIAQVHSPAHEHVHALKSDYICKCAGNWRPSHSCI